jgi:transposase InsO family protein
MPWENREVMSLREDFVIQASENADSFGKLCREYNISRPTGYKWVQRYREEGILGLNNKSTRPVYMPLRTSNDFIDLILAYREKYPAWGARKLRQVLINEGFKKLPSEITFNRILKRNENTDLDKPEKKKKWIRFERKHPNELWQMDFKGYFELKEGRCYPLTILDDCSRYSICLSACVREDEISVRKNLERVFSEYGLPQAMIMDNGSPWKGSPGQRLSKLTVWLMQLGIKVGHSRPYHPQTQGKEERFHRTLKEELLKYHNFRDLADAQKHFDEWRHIYNYVRPHEALGLSCPGHKYAPSERRFLDKLPKMKYEPGDELRRVRHGAISVHKKDFFVGQAFDGQIVALRPRGNNKWDIYFGNNRICGLSGYRGSMRGKWSEDIASEPPIARGDNANGQ